MKALKVFVENYILGNCYVRMKSSEKSVLKHVHEMNAYGKLKREHFLNKSLLWKRKRKTQRNLVW
jgi:hypothetical protein